MNSQHDTLASDLRMFSPDREGYATQFVERLLIAAIQVGCSDVHLLPVSEGLEVRWRIDGVLQRIGIFPRGTGSDIIARLKAISGLLTYCSDTPQEGRIRDRVGPADVRVSTFPSLHGERAVIRMFASGSQFLHLTDLQLPTDAEHTLQNALRETSGALLITGPAGSGKTTTAYACIRTLIRDSGAMRSVVSLEDPIEVPVDGMSQSQIHAPSGFDFATGLRSLMRQDPEVILVGEVRDAVTAETVFQAALTGHVVISTFHSGSTVTAICRLRDMGIEPYLIRSGVLGIINQRLVRRLCSCAQPSPSGDDLGLSVSQFSSPAGCPNCLSTGFRGRLPLVELLFIRAEKFWREIQSDVDSRQLEAMAVELGMTTRWQRARDLVTHGITTPAEIRRVLGFNSP